MKKKTVIIAVNVLLAFALTGCVQISELTESFSVVMTANVFGSGEGHLLVQGFDNDGNNIGLFVVLYNGALDSDGNRVEWEYLAGANRISVVYDGIVHRTDPQVICAQSITVLDRGHRTFCLAENYPEQFANFFNELHAFLFGDYVDNYRHATELFNTLMSHPRRGIPDFIGGVYFSEEHRLVIQIATDFLSMDEAKVLIASIIDIDQVIFEHVKFSHNQLVAMSDYLREFDEIWNFADSFSTVESENRVVVRLRNYSPEEMERFRTTITDSPMIMFAESAGTIEFD